jgi:hypothetical protein
MRHTFIVVSSLLIASVAQFVRADELKFEVPHPPTGVSYFFYELGEPDAKNASIVKLAAKAGSLKPIERKFQSVSHATPPIEAFEDNSHVVRMTWTRSSGSIKWFPDLGTEVRPAPTILDALGTARRWLTDNHMESETSILWRPLGMTTLKRQAFSRSGEHDAPADIMRTVHFARDIDGLPAEGLSSVLSIDVTAKGVVGITRTVLPLRKSSIPVDFKTEARVRAEFLQALAQLLRRGQRPHVHSVRLIYRDQKQHYVQPVYEFNVYIDGPRGRSTGHQVLIAAARNSPEQLSPSTTALIGRPTLGSIPRTLSSPPLKGAPDPSISFGFYINRLSYREFAGIAASFWLGLAEGSGSLPPSSTVTLKQFMFNFPWMWGPGGSTHYGANLGHYNDQSAAYVGSVNFAIVAGHGDPFEFDTFSDCCDSVDLTSTAGFGAANGFNAITNYIVFRECYTVATMDVNDSAILSQYGFIDKYGNPDPGPYWFPLFKGIRGIYGFHTQQDIEATEGTPFGAAVAVGTPIFNAWFSAVEQADDGCATSLWECPSAVVIDPNDTIFDTGSEPYPLQITIWWADNVPPTPGVQTFGSYWFENSYN